MKLPRDLSGPELARALERIGYRVTRQTGSHVPLTTHERGAYHVTIPRHGLIKIGTLSSILNEVAAHAEKGRGEILKLLFP